MSLLDEHGWPASTPEDQLRRVLNALPAIARTKYSSLVRQVSDAKALVGASMARARQLEDGYHLIKNKLAHLDPRTDADVIVRVREELEAARGELEREQQELERHNARGRNSEQVVAQLRDQFLTTNNLRWPVRPTDVTPRRRANESVGDALRRTRQEIAAAKSELGVVRSAPPTADEIKQQLRLQVEALAARGTPTITLHDGKAVVRFADQVEFANPGSMLSAPSGSASALLCALFPQQIIELLESAVPEVPNGLGADERARRVAELEQHVAQLEHQEEIFVTEAAQLGIEVHRRPQASAWALLGIEHCAHTEDGLVAAE